MMIGLPFRTRGMESAQVLIIDRTTSSLLNYDSMSFLISNWKYDVLLVYSIQSSYVL